MIPATCRNEGQTLINNSPAIPEVAQKRHGARFVATSEVGESESRPFSFEWSVKPFSRVLTGSSAIIDDVSVRRDSDIWPLAGVMGRDFARLGVSTSAPKAVLRVGVLGFGVSVTITS